MTPDFTKIEIRNNKPVIIKVILCVAAVIIIASAVLVGLVYHKKSIIAAQIKDSLDTVAASMQTSYDNGGAYPATITDILESSNGDVKLEGSSSFDGTSYCITGSSLSDDSIVFYIDSTNKTPQKGSCSSGSNTPAPSTPGGVAVGFTNGNSISITWESAVYASSYTLECSTDSQFKTIDSTIESTNTTASCSKLKPNTAYYGRVKATNKTSESAWSTIIQVNTLDV